MVVLNAEITSSKHLRSLCSNWLGLTDFWLSLAGFHRDAVSLERREGLNRFPCLRLGEADLWIGDGQKKRGPS